MKNFLKIVFVCLLFTSCNFTSSKYGVEIDKALKYYKIEDADSLKYEAVKFLADNMPSRSSLSFVGQEGYVRGVDSLYGDKPYHIRKMLYNIPLYMGYSKAHKQDVDNVSAEYLISHIDYWFKVWRSAAWLSELSFDDFLNYLLPYRFLNENLQQDEHLLFSKNIDTMINLSRKYEWIKYNIHNHIEWHDVYEFPKEEAFINDSIYLPAPINKKIKLDCVQLANYYNYYYRQHGIPSAIDFVPNWGHINYGHYWCAAIDGVFVYNTKEWFTNTLTPKVYRFTYKHNPTIKDGENMVPSLFQNPFIIDVTKDYVNTSQAIVNLDFEKIDGRVQYAYLSVFNCKDLHEIAVSKAKGRKATFKDMGRRIVYYPVCYEGSVRKALGYPFYIDSNEKLCYLIPDKKQLETRKIDRKYLTEAQKMFWSIDMMGAVVEAANKPDFSDRQLIYKISDHNEHLKVLKIPVGGKFRYVRFVTPKDSVYLSVFRLCDDKGRIISSIATSDTDSKNTLANLYDSDPLTYHLTKGGFTLDVGKSQNVAYLEIAPRTDDNAVVVGDSYELLYYDMEGWVSLGRKVADTDYLEYSGMPKGAIFWLRNHTKGVEERVFSFAPDGKQRFW